MTAKNMDFTEAIKAYTREKIGGLEKFYDQIILAKVVVGLETTHHQKGDNFFCECLLEVPGNDIFVKKEEADLYKAIDKVKDHLEDELNKHKNKMRDSEKQNRQSIREQKEYDPNEI